MGCAHLYELNEFYVELVVRELTIGLIKWLRPKGLKACSYVEKWAEIKIKLSKISAVHKSTMRNGIPRGRRYLNEALKWWYPCRFII